MTSVSAHKITPCLWFDKNAEEAVRFYTSLFKNSKVLHLHPVLSTFEIDGQRLMALNGGPHFTFTEAISLFVSCDSQEEVDYYWEKLLSDGGQEQMCGWLKDRFGLSWQIVPTVLSELMSDPNPVKSKRVYEAMLKMVKLDIEGLKRAHAG